MAEILIGLAAGVILTLLALLVARSKMTSHDRRGSGLAPTRLDLRPTPRSTQDPEALELYWNATPLLSIERLDARALPARQPIPGALAELLSGLLDDERVMDLLRGERFAVVRVPAAIRGDRRVQAADGTRLAVKRGAGGRISGIPVLVGGAGTGAAVGVAPVVAGAVAAVWAHQQIESKMSEMRAGLERIALRLDDADHGVIEAAHAHIGRLSTRPALWTDLDRAELAAHRVALERVHFTARRRAERRLDTILAGEDFPRLDPADTEEAQRDLVLLVDSTLARAQLELVRSAALLDSPDPTTGLRELKRIEDELHTDLSDLAGRLDQALEQREPGWVKISARRKVRVAKSQLGQTIDGLEALVTDLATERDAELVISEQDGRLMIEAPLPDPEQ
jgi:hypothetical protein